ncbi:uncharacterized protein LOC113098276 [Carassius auratus]|uniref:Uncharacterized protein LOC113098276 n=1 Tax=Carassius auratus TaxID=7957 RepID=A0A6P6PF46_CARAU|nr:uncharacterized protein LOC113098276 [Carassius auratus]
MRMAVRRMNELCKTMAPALMFSFLLLHSCWGQDLTIPTVSETNTTAVPSTQSPSNGSIADPGAQPTSGTAVQETTSQPSSDNFTKIAPQLFTDTQVNLTTPQTGQLESFKVGQKTNEYKEEDPTSGSSPAVFVPLLVTGLLLAALIIAIYYYKYHCQTNSKGMKLAEESYMAGEESQGNTLVSVAPLNQPEPQEKPSLNGESQEAVKAQTSPAATNGHSTTKTADTEL